MSFFKRIAMLLPMIPLLGGCVTSDDRPLDKVIEYDEEVKLHDGSMIWVHIKRHYIKVYGALGDPGGMGSGGKVGYAPKEVEVSWDMGFPNVGRKSVLFQEDVSYIDFKNKKYFLIGSRNKSLNSQGKYGENCGATYGIMGYAVIYDDKGQCYKPQNWQEFPTEPILNIGTFKISFPEAWNGKKLSWQFKIENSNLFKHFNEKFVQKTFD